MFESPSDLLAYANAYMDSLRRPPKSLEEARKRRKELFLLISEMRRFNFHAPKFGIKHIFSSFQFLEKEELLEALPLLEKFTYSLNIRKWTYERAKVSYMASKLSEFFIKENVMLDYLPYLPHSGEFMDFVESAGGAAFLVFRDLMNTLSGESRTELLFDEEKLVDVKKKKRSGILPVTTATLMVSYSVKRAVVNHWEEILKREREVVRNYDEVMRYESIVSRYDLSKVYENPELFMELFQRLEEEGFLEEDGTVRADILNGVRKKRFFRYNRLWSFSVSYFTLFVLEYWTYFVPWIRKKGVPLRGFPRDAAVTENMLFDVVVPCDIPKEETREHISRVVEVYERTPLPWMQVAETLIAKLCPQRGRVHPHVEELLKSLEEPSQRAKEFMELLGEKDDKDKE